MLPVTRGKGEVLANTSFLFKYRRRSRQPPPFSVPAPYEMCEVGVTWWSTRPAQPPSIGVAQGYAYGSRIPDPIATNRAYEKFVSKIHDTATLSLLFAERREASRMILNRVVTLIRAWAALLRGNFRKFVRTLNVPPKRKHRGVVRVRGKQASAYWLEYWFGWSPFVQDIYTAVELLDSAYPIKRVTAVSGNSRSFAEPFSYRCLKELTVCKISADVEVENEMLYRASQFGIVNPAVVAWELVPFSFLVDWFVPVGNYLRSFTDFVGLRLNNPCTTYFIKGEGEGGYRITSPYNRPATSRDIFVAMTRTTEIPGPTITAAIPERLSVTRGATAISLLVQMFIKDAR